MSKESVVSDSTFYISFISKNEINEPSLLKKFLQVYQFYLGKVILNEIYKKDSEVLENIDFKNLVVIIDNLDFSALLSPIGDKVFKKGEYECMAIAWYLLMKGQLYSIVMDDGPARKFMIKNIPELRKYLKYSTRFIVDSYLNDKKLTKNEVLYILNKIKKALNNGAKPFNISEGIINQLIKEVEECQK